MDGQVNVFWKRECLVCGESWCLDTDGSGDLIVSIAILDTQVETHLLGHVIQKMEVEREESRRAEA